MIRCTPALILLLISAGVAQQAEPQYEMDHYVVGFLKKGPNWTGQASEETKKI